MRDGRVAGCTRRINGLCQLKIEDGQCYICGDCMYHIHKACAELPNYIHHSLHLHHSPLRLDKRSSSNTSACYYCDDSFQNKETLAYACDQCSLHMHTSCALIPLPSIKCYSNQDTDVVQYVCHQNMMALVAHDASKSQATCFVCQSFWSGLAYSCTSTICKNFIHKSCAELPLKIQHPFHLHHPLTLQCDACRKSYKKWNIHVGVEEIMKVIKGNSKDVELMALGENLWYQFGAEKEIMASESEVTLKEVINSLTREEKEVLLDPYDFGYPLSNKTQREEKHSFYYGHNSPLFDHELPSTEDIHKITQFSRLSSTDVIIFILELRTYKSRQGLHLDEKYLRQKVVDVEGCMVPITVARILKTLLHKHGSDLFGGGWRWQLGLSREMKSVITTLLCVVIDRIYNTNIEDVTKDEIKEWFFCLRSVGNIIGVDVLNLVKFLETVIVPVFLGSEAIRYEKDISEKLDLRIKNLEADLERCKETRRIFETETCMRPNRGKALMVREALRWKGTKVIKTAAPALEFH
ncbi:Zinc finger, RING/FYVE/PHD-type [Trema orientale]|uniref:Zinc finger, RING/FYVE/PHD-type n=1 Tax=Trema orientale TaxID=63057 RepID=A0A2P5FJY7_TREOI|nr:Zinc finger, RING/FYVE/PHD-type [Trema orientale]